MVLLGLILMLFSIAAPIYAFIYPSLTSMFFAGAAVTILLQVIAHSLQSGVNKRNFGILRKELEKQQAVREAQNENRKH